MTFEGLLPFILLFIVWGASRILLKMAKTRQKEKAPGDQKPGFFKMLEKNLANLEGMGIEEEHNDLDEYFQATSQPGSAESEEELLPGLEEDSLEQEPAVTGGEPPLFSPPAKAVTRQKKPAAMMPRRRKLQHAVIWAEILAPPLALRDQ
jgi:hypothetical protein